MQEKVISFLKSVSCLCSLIFSITPYLATVTFGKLPEIPAQTLITQLFCTFPNSAQIAPLTNPAIDHAPFYLKKKFHNQRRYPLKSILIGQRGTREGNTNGLSQACGQIRSQCFFATRT
jgi:hypothetical protein